MWGSVWGGTAYSAVASSAAGSSAGTGVLVVGPVTLAGSATRTAPTFTGSGDLLLGHVTLVGAATRTAPASTGSGTLLTAPATLTGSATRTVPVYSGAGALVLGHVTVAAAATFRGRSTGSGTLMVAPAVLAGAAQAVYHPVVALTQPRSGLPARRYGSSAFADKTTSPPVYAGTGVLTVAAVTLSGSAVSYFVHPVGVLTQSRLGLPGRHYRAGAFAGKGVDTSAGQGVLLVAPVVLTSAAHAAGPVVAAAGDLALGAVTLAGAAGSVYHPVLRLTQVRSALPGRRYGSFAGKRAEGGSPFFFDLIRRRAS